MPAEPDEPVSSAVALSEDKRHHLTKRGYYFENSSRTLYVARNYSFGYWHRASCPWDSYRNQIKFVVVEEGVTSIGEYEFDHCSKMTAISLPSSLQHIGFQAFWGCSSLASIDIPNSVNRIFGYAFIDCSSLASITMPNSLTLIGERAFSNCSSLTSVSFPSTLTSINEGAFENCASLTSITLPKGCKCKCTFPIKANIIRF